MSKTPQDHQRVSDVPLHNQKPVTVADVCLGRTRDTEVHVLYSVARLIEEIDDEL